MSLNIRLWQSDLHVVNGGQRNGQLDLPVHWLEVKGMSLNIRLCQSDLPVNSLGVNEMNLNIRLWQ